MHDTAPLIDRWRAGDDRAAEQIYTHYRGSTYRLAYGLLGDAEDAEEVAQDTLVYALSHIERYDPARAAFATWLHTITVSRCRDRRRRRRLPSLSLSRWLESGADAPDPRGSVERDFTRGEARGRVWQAVQALSPVLREAVVLRYWADYSYAEMAEILGCPLRTAQSRVRLAYQQLRERLAPSDLYLLAQEDVP